MSQGYTPPRTNVWILSGFVSLAAFMEVLDTSIASVALPYISGGLGASTDEANWVITSYLVANAVILPIGSWASSVIGRKNFFLVCIALFTISSFLCGIAPSLPLLLVFRVLQGAAGGGLVPSAQGIMGDAFPPAQKAIAFALLGVVAVLAPSVGPTLGGWITDNYSWRWIFFINLPVGVVAFLAGRQLIDNTPISEGNLENLKNLDYIGFGLLALSLSTLQIFLDKGQEKDWLGSNFISSFVAIFVVSTILFFLWEWPHASPLVKVKLLLNRNFTVVCILSLGLGAVLNSGINLMPLLQQTLLGYTATLAGESVTPAGISLIFLFAVSGVLTKYFRLKILAAVGFLMVAFGYYYTSVRLTPGNSIGTLALLRVYQVSGLAFLFTSITTAAYSGLSDKDGNQISGITNLLRNLGGSIAISLTNAAVTRRGDFHRSRIGDHLTASSSILRDSLAAQMQQLQSGGKNSVLASQIALSLQDQELTRQSAVLSYADVFVGLALLSMGALLLAFALDTNQPGTGEARGE